QKAEDWNTDPGKIASIGFSAGGHLSGAMGTMGKERPNAMILGYPVTTPHKGAGLPYPIPGLCDKVDEHTVPAFLFATYDDQLVPVENTIKMGQALSDHGVPFEMHIFQKGKHGLALAKQFCSAGYQDNINDSVAAWFPLCIKWLETQFHPFPADLENRIPTAQEAGVYSVTANTNSRPQFVRITGFSAASSTRQLTANNA
ncbi:MAG: alpha/beta hydrolase, partial [Faecalibacterium prausnitzii]|nr:alpha/beta hydrolase [Faecalibacterium prausnitzii]